MKLLAYFRSVIYSFFHRSAVEKETEAEISNHIQYRADDLQRTGMAREEAERRARIELGGNIRFREESVKALGGNSIETFFKDAGFSIRILRKSPGFTIAAVLTLALAIGANAVVFSVMNGIILRPLGLPKEESLYEIERGDNGFQSYLDYIDERDRNRSFEDLAAFNVAQAGMDTGENPTPAWIYEVTGNYFDALDIKPYLGNFFHSSDEHGANSVPYIVLSYTYWHTRFQDDPSVVGRVVQVNKHPFTVVAVAPPDFKGTLVFVSPDFFVPIVDQEQLSDVNLLNVRNKHWVFMVLGHLKPGVTPAQAAADLNAIGADLEKTYPQEEPHWAFGLARPGLYGNFLGGPIRAFIAGLMLLAGLILVAACANLGSLFAARAADRSKEVALRLALGASRLRILRQLFTEAVLISLAGGTVGLLGSIVLLRWLSVWKPFPRYPLNVPVNPDTNVYIVALLLALASGFLFGAVPVRQILRIDLYETVKSGSRAKAGGKITIRDLLLIGQIAICALLVIASLVAVRGLIRTLHGNFGFNPNGALLVNPMVTMAGYSIDKVPNIQKRLFDTIATIPDVKSVGLTNEPPLEAGGTRTTVFTDQTSDLRPANAAAQPFIFSISPDYIDAAGTVLLAGRDFSWHDDKDAPRVALINQEFARRIFGGTQNAVGGYYKRADGTRIQVVGVVEDGKYYHVTEKAQPAMFLPLFQLPNSETWLVIRSGRDPQQLAPAVRSALRNLDPAMPIYTQTWEKELDGPMFGPVMATMALGVMGALGAMLALTGVFGMAAYSVSKRLKELGIRVALGARRNDVLQAALGRAFKLLAIGSVAGLVLGAIFSRVLSVIVYMATPRDPLVLIGAVLAMALLGLLATWIPARRALSVDPMRLLREE